MHECNSTMQATSLPGSVKSIQSTSNPTIKHIRALFSQRKYRERSNLFVAEGLKFIINAIESGWEFNTLLYASSVRQQEQVLKIATSVHAHGGTILEVSEKVLSTISQRENTQSVIAVFKQQISSLNSLVPNSSDLWIGLEKIRDPGNLGTIIRTVDAIGATGIILIDDSTDPFSKEAVRATMGSIFHVPIIRCSLSEFTAWSKNFSGHMIGTHLNSRTDYREVNYKDPCLLLMGNEQAGLSSKLENLCDALVKIPQPGNADSLNLAVSTGIMLYEICRKRLVLK